MTKVFAIITAGGKGDRFSRSSKDKTPKQFIKLFNKPIIQYPLIAMQRSKAVSGIFISCAAEHFDFLHTLAEKNNITKLTALVEGGRSRFESVKNAFRQIIAEPNDLILIHDAVRPNINAKFIDRLIDLGRKAGEVIPALPIAETVKRENKGFVTETLNRENLWQIQTPQIFRYKVLKDSYRRTRRRDFTDESSLVESAGYKVKITEGTKDNVKITTPEDLGFLKKIMK